MNYLVLRIGILECWKIGMMKKIFEYIISSRLAEAPGKIFPGQFLFRIIEKLFCWP